LQNWLNIKKTSSAFGVKRGGLFGWFVMGHKNHRSDVDILVEFESGRKSFDNFMQLAAFLEKQIGRHVELATPESLSPHIGLSCAKWKMPRVVAEFFEHILDELNYLIRNARETGLESFLRNVTLSDRLCAALK
jgi:predicted nucleotidyltransferase